MNDYHLDPPDHPDLPECCDEEMVDFPDQVCLCPNCGLRQDCAGDVDPAWEDNVPADALEEILDYDDPEECPHSKPWGDCDACDHLADLAFDAAREMRSFRR